MNIRTEAETITDFLRSQKIAARIVGGFTAPAFFVYHLDIAPGAALSKITGALDALQTHIYTRRMRAGVIDVNDAAQRVVVRFSDQPPALEVSRPKPDRLHFSAMPLNRLAPFEAFAGVTFVTKDGQPIVWRLTDPGQPHALVAGTSGSGKSNLLLSLLFSLCYNTDPAALSVFIGDGGNSSLLLAQRLVHVVDVANDAESITGQVAHVAGIVHARKRASATDIRHRVLLVVDELANLLAVMDRKRADALHRDLATIAAEGRKFGVHLVAATQKPLAEVTGSLTKSNFAVRFVGAVASKDDANTAASIPGTGAERLAGKGDFIVRSGMFTRRFQVPFVDSEISTMRAINLRWPAACNAASDIHAIVRPGDMPAVNDASTDSDVPVVVDAPIAPAAPKPPQIPAHVLAVFHAHDLGDGTLRRGWKSAAVTALNNGKTANGTTFQRLSEQADTYCDAYLLTYLPQNQRKMAPILQMAASK